MGYKSKTQKKNIAWFLPRPHPSHYVGGMPLHCEKWLLELAEDILKYPPRTLNLFCGMTERGIRVDLNPEVKPDVLADAHDFARYFPNEFFDVVLADPPYSDDECKQLYGDGFPKLKYKKWTAEADKILISGGLLIVYHKYIMPNPMPERYAVVKRVFIGHRTYHIPRVATYFQKHSVEVLNDDNS